MSDFFNQLTDAELLARLIYGEARGEGIQGMLAVGHVALNRAARPSWWGTTLREVILKPYQFSCFNGDYIARLITPTESAWADCLQVSVWLLDEHGDEDDTHGATHYFADSMAPPDWALSMIETARIGHHIFFK